MFVKQVYLDLLFTEMAVSVLEVLGLQPGALSALQVVVEVIAVLDAVPDPLAATAAWDERQGMHILTTFLI